ncbi:MAG: hypothetical protein GX206_04955 [Clostridiales bacterium]|nr:hypothetical protein [Clostridiales bacterium]
MNKTTNIAKGGLSLALIIILVYIASLAPSSKLTILTISSAVIPYSIITTNAKNSLIVYVAASILSLILIGPKAETIAYVIFFGLYGFLKYFIEKLNKAVFEIILKLAYFNASLFILYTFYSKLFTASIPEGFPIYLLVIGAQVVFFVYDYALSIIIHYIRKRFVK